MGQARLRRAGRRLPDGPELASSLSFYLTDLPPDDMLVDAARAGTLRANLGAHVDRILATQQRRRTGCGK